MSGRFQSLRSVVYLWYNFPKYIYNIVNFCPHLSSQVRVTPVQRTEEGELDEEDLPKSLL